MIYSWTLSTFEPPQACAAFRAHNKCCKFLRASPQRRRWSQNKAQRIDQVGEFVGRNSAKWHWHSQRGRTYLVAKEIHGCILFCDSIYDVFMFLLFPFQVQVGWFAICQCLPSGMYPRPEWCRVAVASSPKTSWPEVFDHAKCWQSLNHKKRAKRLRFIQTFIRTFTTWVTLEFSEVKRREKSVYISTGMYKYLHKYLQKLYQREPQIATNETSKLQTLHCSPSKAGATNLCEFVAFGHPALLFQRFEPFRIWSYTVLPEFAKCHEIWRHDGRTAFMAAHSLRQKVATRQGEQKWRVKTFKTSKKHGLQK